MNDRLQHFCVGPGATVRETMEAIGRGAIEIALMVESGRLVGTVSDGDVRRALLAGARLEDPIDAHVQRNFVWVGPAAGRAEVLDLMRARSISQIPVLDAEGRILALHVMREIVGGDEKPNVAVVMAGGRGHRLSPLTERLPKPMLPVAGRPILERIVLHLVGSGIRRVFLAVNYMADVIETHFGDGSAFGCRIDYLREDSRRPLGTGGPLALLPEDVRKGADPVVALNGDLVTDADLGQLLMVHAAGGYVATMAARSYEYEVPFGVLSVEDGRVVALEEKPLQEWIVNAGVYVIEPRLIERIPSSLEYPITELMGDALQRGERVGVHLLGGEWIDVGRLAELRRARGERP